MLLIRSVKDEIGQRQKIQKIAKRLEEANTHLEELDKIKDDFLSMASHELNTPIAAIEGYLSMILVEKMAGEIPAKVRQYLESVFTSSQRLAHLVKDLLNVSRIEGNRIHIIYEEKPIVDIIKQSIMEIDPKVKEAHHTLTFHEPKKKIPATYLDVTRVTEVLINMLGNSCKYTDPGGKIEINVVSDDQKVVVSVADNGKGIPKERNQAVFEKFSQVDVLKDEVKGTGLGMYISKRFIELMKGKMWFHSDGEGKGTTFYFSLPLLTKKPYDPHDGEGAVLH
ncbi:MAG: HAMP domain-containing sensor histidine kinase [Candidatus Berkelbacteria bacterium]|nr:HAMP domain-containing sensor histidine kinase [Candidatus Berkelbacteria bacterium]